MFMNVNLKIVHEKIIMNLKIDENWKSYVTEQLVSRK